MRNQVTWILILLQILVVAVVVVVEVEVGHHLMVVVHQQVHQIRIQTRSKRREGRKMNLHSYNWSGPSVEDIHGILHWYENIIKLNR